MQNITNLPINTGYPIGTPVITNSANEKFFGVVEGSRLSDGRQCVKVYQNHVQNSKLPPSNTMLGERYRSIYCEPNEMTPASGSALAGYRLGKGIMTAGDATIAAGWFAALPVMLPLCYMNARMVAAPIRDVAAAPGRMLNFIGKNIINASK
jgi:hypothetical protein